MEGIKLQPLPLERQIAIFKLAKTEYKSRVKKYKDIDDFPIKGLCYVLNSILIRFNIYEDCIDYLNIAKVLPIFNIEDCIKLCRKHKYVLPGKYGCFGYWYPLYKYQYRINLLNAIIKELTNQLNK